VPAGHGWQAVLLWLAANVPAAQELQVLLPARSQYQMKSAAFDKIILKSKQCLKKSTDKNSRAVVKLLLRGSR
jgi:hypothetical protein